MSLRQVLMQLGVSQSELAYSVSISQTAISQIMSHDMWPKRRNKHDLKQAIVNTLTNKYGAKEHQIKELFVSTFAPIPNQNESANPHHPNDMEEIMLLRRHALKPETKRVFGLMRDPFAEIRSADEVFLTPDIRYVRESLRTFAKHGGFAAVIGESGAGKSTLRRDLIEWAKNENEPIVIIEPYVLGMEDNDIKGKTLKSGHIAEAIMDAVAPGQRMMRSPESRFRQVHQALKESHRIGNRHVLVIEEAHGLSIPTLKHLKRFFELEDGFHKLLSIMLIGQPELGNKLDERNPSVREIVQRCEMVTLRPLDIHLEAYLEHRFKMAGSDLQKIMAPDAIEALRNKLTGRGAFSVLYPLAVNNVITAALNEAAEIGIPQLNADLIQGV
ncbi:Eha [Methylophaga frappieri]|uniref:Eha n=1 Tax=Methylophaga frappieri (strain ATCC BAA-2434 / DSM 25690 / JAM7) TaxID=754477 RepID=I1YGE0_METFJ|nr:AAA family ATPase [Methylophaga frappieri]AFJ01983.1 Eha [Methylophaga frappieri]